jgi:hypothetical protein
MQGGAANDDLSVGGTTNAIIQSGLFRNSVGGSGGASTAVSDLNDLSDVNITSPLNGQALIYSTGTWINGTPISSSYAATASFVAGISNGTASFAATASNAISASYAATASSADNFTVRGTLTAQTIVAQTITSSIEFITGSTRNGSLLANTHQFTGSVGITGSLVVNGSNVILTNQTSSMSVATASYVLNAVSSSFAATSSFANDFKVNNFLFIDSASIDYQQNLAVATGSFQTILSVATGSYRSAFFDYVAFSGSIVRAGTVVSTWSGSNTEFYENFTGDLGGSTAVVTLQTAISASNIVLQAGISGSAWSVRSLVRLL